MQGTWDQGPHTTLLKHVTPKVQVHRTVTIATCIYCYGNGPMDLDEGTLGVTEARRFLTVQGPGTRNQGPETGNHEPGPEIIFTPLVSFMLTITPH